MKEGWINDDYLILFDETESGPMGDAYGIEQYLPGYSLVAILGWDDFIVRNEAVECFRVPTVPILQKYLERYDEVHDPSSLVPDDRYTGKIKWYVHPLVFGGAPGSDENIIWVDIETHQRLVRWWNEKYQEVEGGEQAG